MATTCNECPDFTCACPVPVCADRLNLGTIADLNTPVYVWIEKQNGKSYLQSTTSGAAGEVSLDLTDPHADFYNEFDGLYLIWVTAGGYYCDEVRLVMTQFGTIATTWGIRFARSEGHPGGTVELIPQP